MAPKWMQEVLRSQWWKDLLKEKKDTRGIRTLEDYQSWLESVLPRFEAQYKKPIPTGTLSYLISRSRGGGSNGTCTDHELEISESIIRDKRPQRVTLDFNASSYTYQCTLEERCFASRRLEPGRGAWEDTSKFFTEAFRCNYAIAVAVFCLHMQKCMTKRMHTMIVGRLAEFEETARASLSREMSKHCTFLYQFNPQELILIAIQARSARTSLSNCVESNDWSGLEHNDEWLHPAFLTYLGRVILSALKSEKIVVGTVCVPKKAREEAVDAMEFYGNVLPRNAAFPDRDSECQHCKPFKTSNGHVRFRQFPKNRMHHWIHDFNKVQDVEAKGKAREPWYAKKFLFPHFLSVVPKDDFLVAFNDFSVTNAVFLEKTVGMTNPEMLALWTDALRDVRTPENCKARTAARVHSHHWWMLFFLSTWMRAHADD